MPAPNIPSDQLLDRIDFIYFHGEVTVLNTEIISMRSECQTPSYYRTFLKGSVDTTSLGLCTYPYPSDHSAVLTSVFVTPIDSPWLINIKKRRLIRNIDFIEVCVSIPDDQSWSIAIVPANKDITSAVLGMYNEPIIYRRCTRFGTNSLSIGEYDALLFNTIDNKPDKEFNRVRFLVVDKDTTIEMSVSKSTLTYLEDTSITIQWKYSYGDRDDFIAIYSENTIDVNNYITLLYTGGKFTQEMIFDFMDTNVFTTPLEVGKYNAIFMSNDQYVELARVSFEIVA